MKCLALSFTLLAASFLSGCGAYLTTITPSAPAGLGGNWQISVYELTAPPPNARFAISGALAVQGSQVTGTFRALPTVNTPCVSDRQDLAFTGALDSANMLTLTSAPFSGSVATLRFPVPPTNNVSTGTATIVGGLCATSATTVTALFTPPVTGTYTGTLTPPLLLSGQSGPPNTPGPATLTLLQADADADGRFPVTGTMTFASTSCTLSPTPVYGIISGLNLTLSPYTTPPNSLGNFSVHVTPAPTSYTSAKVNFSMFGLANPTACPYGVYLGDLTRQ